MKTSIAIIIVSFKSTALLARCLECIAAQDTVISNILILDNGGKDLIPEDYATRFPSIQIYKNNRNIGFAAGNNFLFQKISSCEWIAFVNPDAYLQPDWLSKMLSATTAYPEYSFFASRLVQANHPESLDGDGDVMHISGLAWRDKHNHPVAYGAIKPCEMFSPCAAAALYRCDALQAAGALEKISFYYGLYRYSLLEIYTGIFSFTDF